MHLFNNRIAQADDIFSFILPGKKRIKAYHVADLDKRHTQGPCNGIHVFLGNVSEFRLHPECNIHQAVSIISKLLCDLLDGAALILCHHCTST